MTDSSPDDATLLRLVAQADPLAFGALYDRYARLVFSVAYHTTADQALAEEITQDTFLRVWQKAESYRPEQGSLAGWLCGVARHRAIDLHRRHQTRPEGQALPLDGLGDFEPADHGPGVEGSVEEAQRRQQVRQALGQLPAEQRQALSLAFYRGLTQEQIAQALNAPLGTVKTRIRLGMQKLRQLLEAQDG